jgi:hypothetical protein
VILTNHDDAISMAADDRRFYVAETSVGAKPPREHFERLYAWLEGDGYRKVAAWLRQRDCSAITPDRPPASTDAKDEMVEASLPMFARWFGEQLADPSTKWGRRTVLALGEVQRWVDVNEHLIPAKVARHYHPKMVRDALKAAGWADYGVRLSVPIGPDRTSKFRVWTRDEVHAGADKGALVARLKSEMAAMMGQSPFDVVDGPVTRGPEAV